MSAPLTKIAIVGAGGRIGGAFASALLATGKHTVTALVRSDSTSTPPAGAKTASVDFSSHSSLVTALRGQQFLIITLGVRAPEGLHERIVQAAADAGVPYIMPNVFGPDFLNEKLVAEDMASRKGVERVEQIRKAGAEWVALVCGFWYEWSLALPEPWFGFDIRARKVTFFDQGEGKITTSTWEQCGKAVSGLLGLPEKEGGGAKVRDWVNKPVYVNSFRVSQREILDSVQRVTGTTDKDWEIKHENTKERYERGVKEMKEGVFTGFATALYTRTFFPREDGKAVEGDFSEKGLANDVLGLPKEDLDVATKRAVDMVESGWNPFAA